MDKILIREVEYDIASEWKDIKIGQYYKILELYKQVDDLSEDTFIIRMLSILMNKEITFFYNLYPDELSVFIPIINKFNINTFEKSDEKRLIINGNLYSYIIPQKLNIGEKETINYLQKKSKNQNEEWLNLLAVLIRPVIEEKNEFGEIVYITDDRFDVDLSIIDKRKEYILTDLSASNAMYILESFMYGIDK
jgi:hypothetical protein